LLEDYTYTDFNVLTVALKDPPYQESTIEFAEFLELMIKLLWIGLVEVGFYKKLVGRVIFTLSLPFEFEFEPKGFIIVNKLPDDIVH
jgi:hypothetical protein